jgi:uroporphyrinogen-III synthase
LVPRAQSRDWLASQWRAAGAEVHFVEAYRRMPPQWQPAEQAVFEAACADPSEHAWLLSSSESIAHLVAMPGARDQLGHASAWATHPRIAAAAQAAGFGSVRLLAPELPLVADALRAASPPAEGQSQGPSPANPRP